MALYYMSYDLRRSRNYQPLYDELKKFKAVAVLESLWCFTRFNTTAINLCNHFGQYIDADDGISVTEVNEWASRRALGTPNQLSAA